MDSLIAWRDSTDPIGINGRLYDANGTAQAEAFSIDPSGGDVAVSGTLDGFAALTIAANGTVSFQSYNFSGALTAPKVTVGTSADPGGEISLWRLADGTVLAGWTEGQTGVRAVHLSSGGTPLSGTFLIPQAQSIAALDGGGFVAVWTERGPSADAADVFAQTYEANGVPVSEAFRVNEIISGDQETPSVTGIGGGGFAVSWTGQDADGAGIRARAFDAEGVPAGPEFLVNTAPRTSGDGPHQNLSEISRLSGNAVLVSWYQQSIIADKVMGKIFSASQSIEGSSGPDSLNGTDFKDEIYGLAGDDVLHGRGSNDYLGGGDGNDLLYGDAGADWMQGAAGDDIIFVDNMLDRALEEVGAGYDTAFTTVSFALEAGAEIEALRFSEVQGTLPFDLTGNEFGQILAGNAAGNVLKGNGGDDFLPG